VHSTIPGGSPEMIQFILLFSRVGKIRMQKWYQTYTAKEKKRWMREMTTLLLNRKPKMCNFLEFKGHKIIYKRYASLHMCFAIENDDNELIMLDIIHRFVELLDRYFGNVCELDIIFNFHKSYWILDELILAGELQESSNRNLMKAIQQQDQLLLDQEGKESHNRDLLENYTKK